MTGDALSALLGEDSPFRDAFDAYCASENPYRVLDAYSPDQRDEFAQVARQKLGIPAIANASGPNAALPVLLAAFALDCSS